MTKNKVIYFADKDVSATFRYRCKNICDALMSSKNWQAKYFLKKDFKQARKELSSANLLIISRQTDYSGFAKHLIRLAKKQGITTVLDLDDYVFNPQKSKFVHSSTKEKTVVFWFLYLFLINLLARKVDKFCVTNNFLGKKLQQKYKKPYVVIPNFPSAEQFSLSKKAISVKKQNKNFTIGYFSGTKTHANDFALIEKEICRFLEDYPDVSLKIVGNFELTPSLQKLKTAGQVTILPKVNYKELPKLISSVDVNLAPLVLNDFTNCKSSLKFFEAALVKVPTLASASEAFSSSIQDGINGFLCQKGDWYKNLEFLYKYPSARAKIADNAYKFCLENFSENNIQIMIERALNELEK